MHYCPEVEMQITRADRVNCDDQHPICPKRTSSPALEHQLDGELNHARVVDGTIHYSESVASADVLHAAYAAATGQVKLRVIEQVEELSAEVQPQALANGEMLDQRNVAVHEPRPGDRSARRVAQFPVWRLRKRALIKPAGQCMYLRGRGTSRVCRNRSRLVRISDQLRPIQSTAVPLKIDT